MNNEEKNDEITYKYMLSKLNLITKNIWKKKVMGYGFLLGLNGLFFTSILQQMNLISILSSLFLIYIITSIIIAKLNKFEEE